MQAKEARQAQQAREEQARAKAQAAKKVLRTGEEIVGMLNPTVTCETLIIRRFDPDEHKTSLVQVLGQDNATMEQKLEERLGNMFRPEDTGNPGNPSKVMVKCGCRTGGHETPTVTVPPCTSRWSKY